MQELTIKLFNLSISMYKKHHCKIVKVFYRALFTLQNPTERLKKKYFICKNERNYGKCVKQMAR